MSHPVLAVGVVGVGRVGAVLGAALAGAGHRLVACSAVSAPSRERAERLLPGAVVGQPEDVLAAADLALLTVPDDALPDLVRGLVATGAVRVGQLLVHTSGRHGLQVLAPAVEVGAVGLALHPVMTFTGTSLDVERLRDTVFGVTASETYRPVAEALVLEMGGEPVWVAEADRPTYHAALSHGSNHLVTLVAQASEVLAAAGIADPARALRPLLVATLDNTLRDGERALTGPVSRGDAGTVAAHVAALAARTPDVLPTYRALARATAARALADGRLAAPAAEALLDALAGPADEVGR